MKRSLFFMISVNECDCVADLVWLNWLYYGLDWESLAGFD